MITVHVRYEDDAPLKEWLDDMILAAKTVQDWREHEIVTGEHENADWHLRLQPCKIKVRPEVIHNKSMIAYGFRLPSLQTADSEVEMGVVYPEEDPNCVAMRHKEDEVDKELTEAMSMTDTLERGVMLVMGILISRGFAG